VAERGFSHLVGNRKKMGLRYRNLLKEETTFFVTSTIVKRYRAFQKESDYQILIENLKFYRNKFGYKLLGYVLMPSHYHLLVQMNNGKGELSKFQQDFKKITAKKILEKFQKEDNKEALQVFQEAAENLPRQNSKVWVSRFDDEVIRSEKWFSQKLNYIHQNPVKAGLVEKGENWPYSSARNYLLGDHSLIEIDYPD